MKPFPYRVLVEWSDEDRAYLASVPALPGCLAHGASADQALQEERTPTWHAREVPAHRVEGRQREHRHDESRPTAREPRDDRLRIVARARRDLGHYFFLIRPTSVPASSIIL